MIVSRCFALGLLLVLMSVHVFADSFRIDDIRIEGLQRVSPGTLFSAIPVDINDRIDEDNLGAVVRSLFATGNFEDVQVGRDGNVLVVRVVERPAINRINIDGNKILETDSLLKALKKSGLSAGEVFKQATLDGIQMELQRQYVSQGRYDATIDVDVVIQPRNRVNIDIVIDEGTVAKIRSFKIIGNESFSEDDLTVDFKLGASGFFSFISGNDKYAREKLSADLDTLKAYYLNRGYLEFVITSTQVSVSPDRKGVFITVNIQEGEPYTVGEITFSGDLIVKENELKQLLFLKKGEVFSQRRLTSTEEFMTQRLGLEGYAFAEVEGITELKQENKTVDLKMFVNPGKRIYVRNIHFYGNKKTADNVLRREMRQMEGALSNSAYIERSKVRLQRLGFFKDVAVDTPLVTGTEDLIDANFEVAEQPSGSINGSLGFSQDSGFVFGGSISENNFRGTGNQVSFGVNMSKYQESAQFSYVNPYYTPDGVSRGFSVFYRSIDLDEVNVSSYVTDTWGGAVSYGYPLSESQRINFSVGYVGTRITVGGGAVKEISASPNPVPGINNYLVTPATDPVFDLPNPAIPPIDGVVAPVTAAQFLDVRPGFLDLHGNRFDDITFSVGWSESTLNRGRMPTRGHSNVLGLELTLPGSDLGYYKLTYQGQVYFPMTDEWIFRLKGELGYGGHYGDTEEFPFFKHFFAGGFNSVRGYKSNTLGPRSTPAELYQITPYKWVEVTPGEEWRLDYTDLAYVVDGNNDLSRSISYDPDADPFGGNILVEGGVELIFPLPFVKDQSSIRTAFFIEGGNVFSTDCRNTQLSCSNVDLGELRYSTGVGLNWLSGFGPMSFSLAKALNAGSEDETEIFQFSLGQTF